MIDSDGNVCCDNCGKKHALRLDGKLEWYCPKCKHFNRENTKTLDNKIPSVLLSKVAD